MTIICGGPFTLNINFVKVLLNTLVLVKPCEFYVIVICFDLRAFRRSGMSQMSILKKIVGVRNSFENNSVNTFELGKWLMVLRY